MSFETEASKFNDPEKMANAYLEKYYGKRKIEYPINPFQMLVDEGILFSLRIFIILKVFIFQHLDLMIYLLSVSI